MSPVSSPFFRCSRPGHSQQNHNHLAVIIEIDSVCTFSITLLAVRWFFIQQKLVGGWFPPNWKSSLKTPKIFETTNSCNYLWMCLLNFFTQLVCCVIFLCIAHTSAFVLMITIFCQHNPTRILNGTRTSGTSKIHNFHLDIAKYTKGSNAMFKSYLYLIFSWCIYKYINTSTINYAGNIRSLHQIHMGVSQNRGVSPKMDGVLIMEKTLLKWMIWGKIPTIFGNIHIVFYAFSICYPFSCFTWSLDFKGAEKVRRSGNRDLWSWSVSSDSNIGDPYFMVYKIIPYNWVRILHPLYNIPKQLAFFFFSLLKCVSSDSMESHNIPNVFPCFFSRENSW